MCYYFSGENLYCYNLFRRHKGLLKKCLSFYYKGTFLLNDILSGSIKFTYWCGFKMQTQNVKDLLINIISLSSTNIQ